jgi:hypothetical protein
VLVTILIDADIIPPHPEYGTIEKTEIVIEDKAVLINFVTPDRGLTLMVTPPVSPLVCDTIPPKSGMQLGVSQWVLGGPTCAHLRGRQR